MVSLQHREKKWQEVFDLGCNELFEPVPQCCDVFVEAVLSIMTYENNVDQQWTRQLNHAIRKMIDDCSVTRSCRCALRSKSEHYWELLGELCDEIISETVDVNEEIKNRCKKDVMIEYNPETESVQEDLQKMKQKLVAATKTWMLNSCSQLT
jgi:hypothetical protein